MINLRSQKRYSIGGPLIVLLVFQASLGAAGAQASYIEKCASRYCKFKCETGLDLIILQSTYNSVDSEAARMPDLKTYKYGQRVFTLANNSNPGSTSSLYGDTKSPSGTGVIAWNEYLTLVLEGKSIQCKPSWL
jgi:hypothetical protein